MVDDPLADGDEPSSISSQREREEAAASPLPGPPPQRGRDEGGAAAGDAGPNGDGVDWPEVRHAYETTSETVTSIQTRFGLTRHGLAKVRIAEGWTTRAPIATPSGLPRMKAVGSEALELRLNRLVTIGAAMLERRLAGEGLTEPVARTLTELCRAQEIRMRATKARGGAPHKKKKTDDGYDFRDDPAWLRAELARRLDVLSAVDDEAGAGGVHRDALGSDDQEAPGDIR